MWRVLVSLPFMVDDGVYGYGAWFSLPTERRNDGYLFFFSGFYDATVGLGEHRIAYPQGEDGWHGVLGRMGIACYSLP